MLYRKLSLLLAVFALAAFAAAPLLADEAAKAEKAKNTHQGTFVSAKGDKEFTMKDGEKEHSHTLAADAKIVGPDGKDMKITDLKPGQKIKVTTKEGDQKTATRVQVVDK